MSWKIRNKKIAAMLVMLLCVGAVFGGVFGYKAFQGFMMGKAMSARKMPPVTVTAAKAGFLTWQPQLKAVGSLRAVRGVDVTSEIAGLVRTVAFRAGEEVEAGQLLVQLNADADLAMLKSLEASAELARIVYERDKKQFAAQAVSQATLDADAADLASKQALVAQQAATVAKKAIRAPFAGRLGISTVNPGQYINPGDKIVTLQSLDRLYVDFYVAQQVTAQVTPGQNVLATIDAYPGREFKGRITAVNPRVDTDTRNLQVEATFPNSRRELLPGMFASIRVDAGGVQRHLTLPQTAVSYNPYGETVYIIEARGKGPDGKAILTVRQTFVTVGPTRGDQVAVMKGVREGDTVVTSGQLKLRNGAEVIVSNSIQPSNDAAPRPAEE